MERLIPASLGSRYRGRISYPTKSTPSPRPVPAGERAILTVVGQVEGPCSAQRLDGRALEDLRAVRASYQGHLAHANAWRLMHRLWADQPLSRSVLSMVDARVVRRLELQRACVSLREQCFRPGRGLPPAALLVEVGRFAECRQQAAALRLGLPWVRSSRACRLSSRACRGSGRWNAAVPAPVGDRARRVMSRRAHPRGS